MSTSDSVELAAAEAPAAVGRHRSTRTKPPGKGDLGFALLFILPAAIGFLTFYLYPTIRGIYFSLTRYSLLGQPTFIGFSNYARLFKDPLFYNSLIVTVQYVLINIVRPDDPGGRRSRC